jgi:thiamine-monophosphate kinase
MQTRAEDTRSPEGARLQMVRAIFSPGSRGGGADVVLGVEGMDDAALLRCKSEEEIVVTSDFVRGSGFYLFELGYLDYCDVGFYLIMANASDLAAMGARPVAATTIIRYADGMTDGQFVDALRGIRMAADQCGLEVIGGDIGGHSSDVFAATLIGRVEAGHALRRSGALVGDVLCVTGPIGRPITALTYFKKAKAAGLALNPDQEDRLLASWRRPNARLAEGRILASLGWVTACQDISDGLKASLDQLGNSSGVSFSVDAAAVPIDPVSSVVADFMSTDVIALATSASVDFELLFTVPAPRVDETLAALKEVGCVATPIGRATEKAVNLLISGDGTPMPMPGVAWEQQTGDYLADIIKRGARP